MSSSPGVLDFLQQQSASFLHKLYGHAWVCRGVFQSLLPLSKCYIMRLIFIEEPIGSSHMRQWCESDQEEAHLSTIRELLRLRIFSEAGSPEDRKTDEQWFILNSHFRSSIKANMVNLSRPWHEDAGSLKPRVISGVKVENKDEMMTSEDSPPFIADLEAFSHSRWNTILEFLVTADNSLPVSPRVVSYLLSADLMQVLGGNGVSSSAEGQYETGNKPALKRAKASSGRITQKLSITTRGYEYMLLDIQSQVWLFVLECLKDSVSSQVEILSMIFMLSFCRQGTGYPVAQLNPPQQQLLADLCDIGVVFMPSREGADATSQTPATALFYPTHIAINMVNASYDVMPPTDSKISPNNALKSLSLTIIVETNFQVVAYVSSNLHLAMLSLFVDTRSMIRLPNMLMGNITRDSAKAAFRLGISAQQIIGFLTSHAHPIPAKNHPVIPENVSDQLKLWQAEKKRFLCQAAVVVDVNDVADGPYLVALYDELVRYARDVQVLLWENPRLREFAVTPEGFSRVQKYAATLDEHSLAR